MATQGPPDGKALNGAETITTATAPQAAHPYLGIKIKDRYRIERELGRGGFGVVYLARDEQLSDRPVVIKVLLEQSDSSEWFSKKFRDEKDALARIDHPGVVGVLDAGEMPDGKPFLVMQHVDGVTLRTVLQGPELPLRRIAHLIRRIGQALTAAHEKGVYHRDLKPENIMLQDLGDGEEAVKIIDFGIATVKESHAQAGVETRVAGSGPYMAPEQLLGKPSGASDIYSMGVIAYEMVTGKRPFTPVSLAEMYLLQKNGVQVKPAELRADLPAAAQNAILKALAFDADQRYARARDFGEELSRALASDAAPATAPGTSPVVSAGPSPGASPAAPAGSEMSHVLFMDIVGYSLLPMERQRQLLEQLQEIIRGTAEFRRAEAAQELVSRAVGDGVALAFFRDPVAPVECAVQISRALAAVPEIRVRMGIHTGPVYRTTDINAARDVTGGGINLAQRVMDCGDAGHILLSRSVAEVLSQFGQWTPALHDLGEQEVKHGVRVHLFNLYTAEVGNPALPQKLRASQGGAKKLVLIAGVAAGLLAVGLGVMWAPRLRSKPVAGPIQPDRVFYYSILVQKPNGSTFVQPGEMLFPAGYRIRLRVSSPQAGYFYLLNEGPGPEGRPIYNVMFPGQDQTAVLPANQTIRIPGEEKFWIKFDAQEGTEKLWMVWSSETVPELEAVQSFAASGGTITDPARLEAIRVFLAKHQLAPPVAERDEENQQTNVRGKGGILVRLLKLEHR